MAERLFVAEARKRGHDAMALSMGTLGLTGKAAARNAVAVMEARGIDLRDHRSQPVRLGLLKRVSHIYVMERAHIDAIATRDRSLAARLELLGSLDGGPAEVADPVGQSRDAFEQCAVRLEHCIRALLDHAVGSA
jgi:protein-tyrosine phosphatase